MGVLGAVKLAHYYHEKIFKYRRNYANVPLKKIFKNLYKILKYFCAIYTKNHGLHNF